MKTGKLVAVAAAPILAGSAASAPVPANAATTQIEIPGVHYNLPKGINTALISGDIAAVRGWERALQSAGSAHASPTEIEAVTRQLEAATAKLNLDYQNSNAHGSNAFSSGD